MARSEREQDRRGNFEAERHEGGERGAPEHPDASPSSTPCPDSSSTERAPAADRQLVERLLAGHSAARREFVERMGCVPVLVERRLRRLGVRPQAAEVYDISQDVFAAVWERLPEYRAEGNLEAWVHGFVMRVALTSMRRHARAPRSLDAEHAEALMQPEPVASSEQDDQLLQLIELAPTPDREVLALRYEEGLGYPALARRLGCSERAARGRIDRAKAKIRELAKDLRQP